MSGGPGTAGPVPESTDSGLRDLVVVGGGPAGLAVALHGRQAGLSVTVLDRARPPIDKPCGEGLMPDGVARLRELGVALPASARPFRGIRYLDEETVAEGRFPSPPDGTDPTDSTGPSGSTGWGVRRTELHAAMVQRAEAAGVELLWGERAEALIEQADAAGVATADGRAVLGRWLAGADGLLSSVRRWALGPAPAAPNRSGRFGVRRHFAQAPWTDLVEVHWTEGCEAYVTPVGPETVGVAMLWSPERVPGARGFDELLARFPRLAERLAAAPPASRDRGCGPLAQRVRSVARGRIALVGDAGGYLDAITGEGLSLAFHQADALVRAIVECERHASADLSAYARAHRRIRRTPEALIRLLLFAERRPGLRRRLLRALAADPALFDRILGVHARTLPLRALGYRGPWRLVQRLLR